MDSESSVTNIQPCSSKSIKMESSNTNHIKIVNDPAATIVIIDDDDSLDSAYETASAVSRSTQSSPTRKHTFSFVCFDDIKLFYCYYAVVCVCVNCTSVRNVYSHTEWCGAKCLAFSLSNSFVTCVCMLFL